MVVQGLLDLGRDHHGVVDAHRLFVDADEHKAPREGGDDDAAAMADAADAAAVEPAALVRAHEELAARRGGVPPGVGVALGEWGVSPKGDIDSMCYQVCPSSAL